MNAVTERPRVFVTDGSYRNGLAAIRALSRSGLRVTVGERIGVPHAHTIGFWSRHCAERFEYPDPRDGAAATIAALREHFATHRYAAAVPVGLVMTDLFVHNRLEFDVPIMSPPLESFDIAADKRRTYEFAASIGLPIPRTVAARDWRDLEPPLVFKHPRTSVLIAHNADEAHLHASALGAEIESHVAQEFIPGENGFGYFGFFQDGRETAYFMHERLMQYPREGGPSVVARSIRDDRLHELGRRLLEALQWNGVAMVEFKRSERDGELYLMEINPKLWGSLDLAIACGCNFPVWIAQALIDHRGPDFHGYPVGITYQWTLPIGVQSFLRYPEFRREFLRNLTSREIRKDLTWADPFPTAAGVLAGILASTSKRVKS